MPSSSNNAVINDKISFFFKADNVSLYIHINVWCTYTRFSLFIHSLTDLGCFYAIAFANNAAFFFFENNYYFHKNILKIDFNIISFSYIDAKCNWQQRTSVFLGNCSYIIEYWFSLVAQTVKNPLTTWETWAWSLAWEDPLDEGMATHSSILAWRIPMDRGIWWATVHGVAQSLTWLSDYVQHNGVLHQFYLFCFVLLIISLLMYNYL